MGDKIDFKELGYEDIHWIHVAQDMAKWWVLVKYGSVCLSTINMQRISCTAV
jgi:hypothetical protein